jgi:hypothetical protein
VDEGALLVGSPERSNPCGQWVPCLSSRFAALGDVQLPIAAREPIRDLQLPEDISEGDRKISAGSDAPKKRRRA